MKLKPGPNENHSRNLDQGCTCFEIQQNKFATTALW
ncbi:hypothetical protein FHS72_000002 [Loktanella ponticola]|uniref:Uncharacterized protein n=1 Tax=Yoonia ponticola TaxID=1524255 RepID=A0A7W9EWA2_9RHOB|nr:hypothetical protein [Yoonia ponticola]